MAVRHVDLPFSEDFSSWGPMYHGEAPLDSLINPCWNFATTLNRAFIYHDWDESHYVIMHNDYGEMSALVSARGNRAAHWCQMIIPADSIGLYEATVSVDDTTQPDLRQFIISLVDDTHQAFDSIATTGTSCTFTHLDQGSRYYVWVRNIQTIDRNPVWSPWAGPVA